MSATSAIYHLHFRHVSRSTSSATASLAYMIGQPLKSAYDGEVKRPGIKRAHRVLKSAIMLPDTAPADWQDKDFEFIAAQVELAEKRKNARPAASMDVALPRGMSWEEREQIVREFISKNFNSHGYIACYALHQDANDNNPHAHIWISERRLGAKGWLPKFKSEYVLDANGNRIPVIDPATGKQKIGARNRRVWKKRDVDQNLLSKKEFLINLRTSWADCLNAHLEPSMQVSEKSNRAQGKEEAPTQHEGWKAREMGEFLSDRVSDNVEVKLLNERHHELKKDIRQLVKIQLQQKIIKPITQLIHKLKDQLQQIWSGEKEPTPVVGLRSSLKLAREKWEDLQQAGGFHKRRAQREFESAWANFYQQIPSTVPDYVRMQIPENPDGFTRWYWLETTLTESVKSSVAKPLQKQLEAAEKQQKNPTVDEQELNKTVARLDVDNPIWQVKTANGELAWTSKRLEEMLAQRRRQYAPQPAPEPVEPMPTLGKAGISQLIQQRLQQAQQAPQTQPQQPQQPIRRRHIRR